MRIVNWLTILGVSGFALSVTSRAMALAPEDDPDYKGKSEEGSEEEKSESADKEEGSGADIVEDNESKKTLNPDDIDRAREAEKASSVEEDPKKTYYFVGLRYRAHIVPNFMMNLFGDGGTTVWANAFGPEMTVRKDAFEYVFSAWWTGYYMDWTSFKGSSDPSTAWERVKSDIQVLYLTTDFNFTKQVSPVFGLNLSIGAGIGVVWGDLYRRQAYPLAGTSPSNPDNYTSCLGPGNPNATYCDNSNKHYGGYTEPSWANGGQKPNLFPWLGLGGGVRIKPHRNFMARIDVGWGLIGPYLGIAGNYGI
jgi:hypothetical protein